MRSFNKRFLSLCLSAAMTAAYIPAVELSASAAEDPYDASVIVTKMGMGFNIGNTMDAHPTTGLDSESSWGNPKITKAQIQTIKAKGFSSIRLPVTWYNHMDSDYNVDSAWFARVHQVVDWCIDEDMYVILNIHHEEWNRPTDANYTAASTELKALWQQIAGEFKDCDYHLVFEGMNEPRNYSGANEWDGTSEMRKVVNKLNADFVSTVRATGGNNPKRALMLPTYAASMSTDNISVWEDAGDSNVIVSIHAYTPYNFTMNEYTSDATSTFSDAIEAELKGFFTSVSNTFISKRIPVVIGEFSASNKDNLNERVKWAKSYAAQAKTLGIPCFLWDNNVPDNRHDGEAHGYLNRSSNTWYSQSEDVVDALINTYNSTETDLPEEIHTPELTNPTTLFSGSKTLTGYSNFSVCHYDFSKVNEDTVLAITFTGDTPKMVILNGSPYNAWTEISPYLIENGVAYFRESDMADAFRAKTGNPESDPFKNADQIFAMGGASTTVTKVVIGQNSGEESFEITSSGITLSPTSYTYDGSAKQPAVTVKVGTKTLTRNTDYTVAYSNNMNAGTATVTVTAMGNYTGGGTKTFTISPKTITSAMISVSGSYTYTGKAITPSFTVKNGTTTLIGNTDYTSSLSNNVNAGSATLTIKGKGNYSGTATKTFSISRKALTAGGVTITGSYTYTGSAITPTYTVKDGTTALKKDTDYTINLSNNTNAGQATLTVVGMGNYSGTIPKTFNIARKTLDASSTTISGSYTYTGSAITPIYTVKNGTKTLTEGTDFTAQLSNNIHSGLATLKIIMKGNFLGDFVKEFTIASADINKAEVYLEANSYVKTGQQIKPAIRSAAFGGKALTQDDYILSYGENTAIGTGTVTLAGKGNFTGTKVLQFLITDKEITLTDSMVTLPESYKYTGSAIIPEVVVNDGSRQLGENTDYIIEYANNTNIGKASVRVTGMGIYKGSVTKSFEITSLKGDVNFDGKVNTTDCIIAIAFLKGTKAPKNVNEIWAADANNDSTIKVADVMKLIQVAKGKLTKIG